MEDPKNRAVRITNHAVQREAKGKEAKNDHTNRNLTLGVQSDRIKLQLQIHQGDDQEEFEKYWEEIAGIPRNQFNKTIIRPVGNKVGKSKGTCKIRVHDKRLFLEVAEKLEKLRGVVHR